MSVTVITGGKIVTPKGILSGSSILIREGTIQEISPNKAVDIPQGAKQIAANGMFILPGLISLHSSFLEKELFPRTGVEFPIERALIQGDRVMAASGIVEAYHTVRLTLKASGLSLEGAEAIASSQKRGNLLCMHRLHLIGDEATLPVPRSFAHSGNLLSTVPRQDPGNNKAETGLSFLIQEMHPSNNREYSSVARVGSPPEFSATFRVLHGPSSAREAKSIGAIIIARVPYLVGSPSDKPLEEAFTEGLVDLCVADCYAPSLLYAAFHLDRLGVMPLHEAVGLASRTPAQVLGKENVEGSLEVRKVANLCLVELWEGIPRVVKAIIRGELVFSAESLNS